MSASGQSPPESITAMDRRFAAFEALVSRGDYRSAEAFLKESLHAAATPEDRAQCWTLLHYVHAKQRDHQAALTCCLNAEAETPLAAHQKGVTAYFLAYYHEPRDPDAVIEKAREMIAIADSAALCHEGHRLIAETELSRGQHASAAEHLKDAFAVADLNFIEMGSPALALLQRLIDARLERALCHEIVLVLERTFPQEGTPNSLYQTIRELRRRLGAG